MSREICSKCGKIDPRGLGGGEYRCPEASCPMKSAGGGRMRRLAWPAMTLALAGGLIFSIRSCLPQEAVEDEATGPAGSASAPAAMQVGTPRVQIDQGQGIVLKVPPKPTRKDRQDDILAQQNAVAGQKYAPTFGCDSAVGGAQRAICGDARLALMDRNIALMYRQALSRSPDPARLRREHQAWLDGLADLPPEPAVIQDYYRKRIDQLAPAGG